MLALIGKRLLLSGPLLIAVTLSVFVLVSLMPGDPAQLLAGTNPELAPHIREDLRLDDPLWVRYERWAADAVRGDLGDSWLGIATGVKLPVTQVIMERAPITLSLSAFALSFAICIAMVFGTLSAVHQGRAIDRMVLVLAALGLAIPGFWLAYLAIYFFAVRLGWLPPFGYEPLSEGLWAWASHLILPSLILSLGAATQLTLQLRGALIDTFGAGYILSARAKGLSQRQVVWKHAMKNAAMPVTTIVGFQLAHILAGAVIIEQVFNIPGLGTLAIKATFDRDVPVILGLLVLTTVVVIVANALTDIAYGYLNPKVRTPS